MQTRDAIQKIKIKNFGTIDNMFFDKFQNINLIIVILSQSAGL